MNQLLKKKKAIHTGQMLDKAIKEKEHNASKIARLLQMSRPTLYSRIEDGLFTDEHLQLLADEHYFMDEQIEQLVKEGRIKNK